MSILETIWAAKRDEAEVLRRRRSMADWRSEAEEQPPTLGFRRALIESRHRIALIAEVKRASPVKGVLRKDFDPVEIAGSYLSAGADCLSVLTDGQFFQGAADYLDLCRSATRLPVLRKDFILDEVQVYESRTLGADAILLIVNGLSDAQLFEYSALAKELGMDVIVEIHTADESQKAINVGADLIGVNNRDLETFETRLGTALELIPVLAQSATIVSESALASAGDIETVHSAGARAVLIGSAFCGADDIEAKVIEVMGW